MDYLSFRLPMNQFSAAQSQHASSCTYRSAAAGYVNDQGQLCECAPHCGSCIFATEPCLACLPGYFSIAGYCVASCDAESGFMINPSSGACERVSAADGEIFPLYFSGMHYFTGKHYIHEFELYV